MANEGYGATSTIMSGATAATQANSTVLIPKGADRLFLYMQFDYTSSNLTDFRVELSFDGGSTWFIDAKPSSWRTTAISADTNWRTVVDLGNFQGSNANLRVRVGATAAGTGSTLLVKARFNRVPNTYYVN